MRWICAPMRHCLLCNGAAREQDVVVLLLTFFCEFDLRQHCLWRKLSDVRRRTPSLLNGCWYRRRLWHVQTSVCVCTVPPRGVHHTHLHTDTHTNSRKGTESIKKRPRCYCIPNTLDTFIWHVAVIYFGVIYEESTTGTSYVSIKQHPTSVRQLEKWEADRGRRLKVALANLEICFLKLQYVMIFFWDAHCQPSAWGQDWSIRSSFLLFVGFCFFVFWGL